MKKCIKNAADIHVIKLEFVPHSRSVLEALHLASSSLLLSPQPREKLFSAENLQCQAEQLLPVLSEPSHPKNTQEGRY